MWTERELIARLFVVVRIHASSSYDRSNCSKEVLFVLLDNFALFLHILAPSDIQHSEETGAPRLVVLHLVANNQRMHMKRNKVSTAVTFSSPPPPSDYHLSLE